MSNLSRLILYPLIMNFIICGARATQSHSRQVSEFRNKPYIALFKKGDKQLIYLAAKHEKTVGSSTFKLVDHALTTFHPNVVVIEGVPTSVGLSPKGVIATYTKSRTQTLYRYGEASYVALKTHQKGIPFIGGEPDQSVIVYQLKGKGFSLKDFVGFFFVRRATQIKGGSAESAFNTYTRNALKKSLGLPSNWSFTYSEFKQWYQEKNKKSFDVNSISSREIQPMKEGALFTQRMAYEVSALRNTHIVKRLEELLNRYNTVLIVYGKGHLKAQREALIQLLGKPEKEYTL